MSKTLAKLSAAALLVFSVNAMAAENANGHSVTPDVPNESTTNTTPEQTTPAKSTATSGTVTFEGTITSNTCYVSSNSVNKTVKLPAVKANDLSTAGQTAGDTAFTLTLEDCPVIGYKMVEGQRKNNVSVAFDSTSANVDTDTGNLKEANPSGNSAKNVQIQLLNKDGKKINLASAEEQAKLIQQPIGNTGNVQFDFTAQYYAKAAAEPGSVVVSIPFSIDYQ